jgi:hypothetical protein
MLGDLLEPAVGPHLSPFPWPISPRTHLLSSSSASGMGGPMSSGPGLGEVKGRRDWVWGRVTRSPGRAEPQNPHTPAPQRTSENQVRPAAATNGTEMLTDVPPIRGPRVLLSDPWFN